MKAIITFLASSGLRRSDTVKLTVHDFFNATKDYHRREVIHDNDIAQVITELKQYSDIIPLFHITSEKTETSHIAFCSNESVLFICQMLRERLLKKEVRLDDRLFEIREEGLTKNFQRLNDKLGYGWKENRRKFHPHSLRKFFATTLTANDVDYLSTEFLLGHRLSSVQSSYYFANPEKLKLKYSRVMPKLPFVTRINEVDIVSSELREMNRLREENKETRRRLYELEEMIDMLRNR
jgi:integrase